MTTKTLFFDSARMGSIHKRASLSRKFLSLRDNESIIEKETVAEQTFFVPNTDKLFVPAEISCLEMANDGATICIATIEVFSNCLFWDMTSQSFKGKLQLHNCIIPKLIRFSFDSRLLICCGLSQDRKMAVYFCCAQRHELLSLLTFTHSPPSFMKDAQFIPQTSNEFFNCGKITLLSLATHSRDANL